MDSTSHTYLPMAQPRTIPMLSGFYHRPPLLTTVNKKNGFLSQHYNILNSDSLVENQQNHQIYPSTMQTHPHLAQSRLSIAQCTHLLPQMAPKRNHPPPSHIRKSSLHLIHLNYPEMRHQEGPISPVPTVEIFSQIQNENNQ